MVGTIIVEYRGVAFTQQLPALKRRRQRRAISSCRIGRRLRVVYCPRRGVPTPARPGSGPMAVTSWCQAAPRGAETSQTRRSNM